MAEIISLDPEAYLGASVSKRFEGKLPFLFKVLSVDTALSIQAHPDKKLAARLHAERPDVYKDGNHKPEMVIALTVFEALLGFRSLAELVQVLDGESGANSSYVPEVVYLIGSDAVEQFLSQAKKFCKQLSPGTLMPEEVKTAFQRLLQLMLTRPQGDVDDALKKFVKRTAKAENERTALVHRLHAQYPGGDIGCFMSLFFNYVTLQPGQGAYLLANEPHAYLSGDCVECMAASDNVVRCGLTPKLKDVPVLLSMLTFKTVDVKEAVVEGSSFQLAKESHRALASLYEPPIPEFKVLKVDVQSNGAARIPKLGGPGVLLATSPSESDGDLSLTSPNGHTVKVSKGHIYFLKASLTHLDITMGSSDSNATVYIAYCS